MKPQNELILNFTYEMNVTAKAIVIGNKPYCAQIYETYLMKLLIVFDVLVIRARPAITF